MLSPWVSSRSQAAACPSICSISSAISFGLCCIKDSLTTLSSRPCRSIPCTSLPTDGHRWPAAGCRNVFGLPRDGHVVHSIQQGRMRYLGAGPNAELRVEVSPTCESKWDLAAHRCGVWLIAHSSVGKDNALAAHRAITQRLRKSFPDEPCLNELVSALVSIRIAGACSFQCV